MSEQGMSPPEVSTSLEDNISFQEWKECQKSLETFDKMILDLRKYGFGLITILFGADGFLFSQVALGDIAILGIYFALLVLITGLFRLDRVHEIFLRAAVSRAMELEDDLGLGLSRTISEWSRKRKTATWGIYLYISFCIAAFILTIGGIVNTKSPLDNMQVLIGVAALVLLVCFIGLIIGHHLRTKG
jgi:hypothetical protein